MEVILNKDIDTLGEKGDIIKVKAGYGRNYLIPRGIAQIANIANKKVAEQNRIQVAHKASKIKEVAEENTKILDGAEIQIKVKSGGDSGKIFGSITTLQISELISKEYKIKIDPKNIIINKSIKLLGSYEITLKLHKDISCIINLKVSKEE